MNIFDGHADIFSDINTKRILGEEDIFKNYHLNKFKKGEIIGAIFIAYLRHSDKIEDEKAFTKILTSTLHELNTNNDIFHIIKSKKDCYFDKEKTNVLMGVEGLRAIGTNLDWIDLLYGLGFRHAILTWNEENLLGTGILGDESHGLTKTGIECIKKLEKLGMVIDTSHNNVKTFWDIYDNTTLPFIASHSNSYTLCPHKRNLNDEQIKAIGEKKGLIGINAYKYFVSQDKNKHTLSKYVDHIEYIVDMIGIDRVGLGFDFCEYLSATPNEYDSNPVGLEDATMAQNVIKELERRNYKKNDIEKIASQNFLNIFSQILK